MSIAGDLRERAGRVASPSALDRALAWTRGSRAMLLVVLAALIGRCVLTTATDVSWLITMSEKALAGERMYIDVVEVNPPASFFLYMLPVRLSQLIGIAPEIVVNAFVLAGAAASVAIAARALARAKLLDGLDRWTLAAWVFAILAVLPMRNFAQREHIALIALMPFLAVLFVRARHIAPDWGAIVAAGLGAGVTICIKPHFALAVGFAIVASALGAKSWRGLFAPENWIAGALAAAYGALVLVAYPEFVREIVPLVQAVYLPVKMPLWKLMLRPDFLCWLIAIRLLTIWRPRALFMPPHSILLAASAGFALAYFIQAKGWPYHSYPMVALAFIALAVAAADRATSVLGRGAPVAPWMQRAMLAAIVVASCVWGNFHRSMEAAVAPIRQAVANPRMLVIAADFSIGHPLTRQVGGEWVSRVGSLWISADVFQQLANGGLDPERRAWLIGYAEWNRDMLAEDIARRRPDIIVVQRATFDWMAWADADPKIGPLLKAYRPIATVPSDRWPEESFVILRR